MSNALNTAAALAPAIKDFCSGYTSLGFELARLFLIAALVAAVVETGVALWSKVQAVRAAPGAAPRTVDPAALAKLLDALKGLLEALAKLPAWIAIFLAGLALLWMAAQQPEFCKQPSQPQARQPAAAQPSGQGPPPQTGTGVQPAPVPPRGG